MKVNPLIIGLVGVVVVVVIGATVLSKRTSIPQTSASPSSVTSQSTEEENAPNVPQPIEEDVIRAFYNIINEGRPADAISMMTPSLIGDDASKQAWGVQFNSFKSVSVVKIEPSMQEEWTATKHTYRVTLDVQMKPEAQNAPIPNYGWENGQNIRWITLEKVENLLKIAVIATGP